MPPKIVVKLPSKPKDPEPTEKKTIKIKLPSKPKEPEKPKESEKPIEKKPIKLKLSPKEKAYLPPTYNGFPIINNSLENLQPFIETYGRDEYYNIEPTGVQIKPKSLDFSKKIVFQNYLETTGISNYSKLVIISKLLDFEQNTELLEKLEEALESWLVEHPEDTLPNKDDLTKFRRTIETNKALVLENEEKRKNAIGDLNKTIEDENALLFQDGSAPDRLKLDNWVLPSRKNFPGFINTIFADNVVDQDRKNIKIWDPVESRFVERNAFSQQKFVSDYLSDNTPYRGLLLYHGLGSGKSGASIMIAEGFKTRKIVIMVPATLESNYRDEIRKWGGTAYKTNFFWTFIPIPEVDSQYFTMVLDLFEEKGISKDLLPSLIIEKKIDDSYVKGLYMIDLTKTRPNYDVLDAESKKEVSEQVNKMLNFKYSFIHYNAGGYTILDILKEIPNYQEIVSTLYPDKRTSELKKTERDALLSYIYDPVNKVANPFDNKVVIVDEVHNLISRMVGGGVVGNRVYELIMRASNCKLVCMSGTPVINTPYELALLFNMLRGLITSYNIPLLKSGGSFNSDEIETLLNNNLYIDRFSINSKNNTIDITRNPYGFITNFSGKDRIGVTKSNKNIGPDSMILDKILLELSGKNYNLNGTITPKFYSMFPDILVRQNPKGGSMIGNKKHRDKSIAEFNELYINPANYQTKNDNDFMNRITGLVSFFNEISGKDEETGADLFPRKEKASEEETTIYMSDYQFIEYYWGRHIERQLEQLSKKSMAFSQGREIADGAMGSVNSYYRVFSRQSGNFVFPPNIKRPRPPKKSKDEDTSRVPKARQIEIKKQIIELYKKNRSSDLFDSAYEDYVGLLGIEESFIAMEIKEKLMKRKRGQKETELMEGGGKPKIVIPKKRKETSETKETKEDLEDIVEKAIEEEAEELVEEIEDIAWEEDSDMDDFIVDELDETKYEDKCQQAIEKLSETNLTINSEDYNLMELSPKFALMLSNIDATPGLVFVYSYFRAVEGINVFSKVLEANGYHKLHVTDKKDFKFKRDTTINVGDKVRYSPTKDDWYTYDVLEVDGDNVTLDKIDTPVNKKDCYRCCYALWTGAENADVRRNTLNVFTDINNNMFGQNCLILLATASGAEGINLYNVRQVHITEPYWNNVKIEQAIGRGRRLRSHVYLPERHRDVKVFNYAIKFTEEQINGKWGKGISLKQILDKANVDNEKIKAMIDEITEEEDEEKRKEQVDEQRAKMSTEIREQDKGLTSDQVLLDIANKKSMILGNFLKLIKEAAVDCNYNRDLNIRSNPELADLKCNNIILTESAYTYPLTGEDLRAIKKPGAITVLTKTVVKNKLVIPYRLSNGKVVKLLALLEEGKTKVSDLVNGQEVYDFYLYNGLNYKDLKSKTFHKIGTVNIGGAGGLNIVFLPEFENRLNDYYVIEECMMELGLNIPPTDEVEKNRWAERIKDCHRSKNRPVKVEKKWKCIACDIEYPWDIEVCKTPGCGFTKDIYLEMEKISSQAEPIVEKPVEVKKKVVKRKALD